jgi:hypothetical protein
MPERFENLSPAIRWRLRTQVIEKAGAQLRGDCANGLHGFIDGLPDRLGLLARTRATSEVNSPTQDRVPSNGRPFDRRRVPTKLVMQLAMRVASSSRALSSRAAKARSCSRDWLSSVSAR